MNKVEANRTIIEIVINLVCGGDLDKKRAEELTRRLDEQGIRRLKTIGEAAAILAENVFFEQRRKRRGDTYSAWPGDDVWRS